MPNHRCELFHKMGVPCPTMDVFGRPEEGEEDEEGGEERRPVNRPPLVFPPERRRPPRSKVEVDFRMELIHAQERIGRGLVGPFASVAFNQLRQQGMIGVPSFQNGGMQWMLELLSSPRIASLFLGLRERPQGLVSGVIPQGFEQRYAQVLKRQVEHKGNVGPRLSQFVQDLVRAVAFAGLTGAAVFGTSKAVQGVRTSVGSGGGGMRVFQAPTFRPGLLRRKPGFGKAESFPEGDPAF